GDDLTEEAVRPFFTREMGKRRCQTLRVVSMDMCAPYAKLVGEDAVNAQLLFDRFHIVKHLNEAVEEVRRSEMRRLSQKEKVPFQRSRWLLLKNPWNLSDYERDALGESRIEGFRDGSMITRILSRTDCPTERGPGDHSTWSAIMTVGRSLC